MLITDWINYTILLWAQSFSEDNNHFTLELNCIPTCLLTYSPPLGATGFCTQDIYMVGSPVSLFVKLLTDERKTLYVSVPGFLGRSVRVGQ